MKVKYMLSVFIADPVLLFLMLEEVVYKSWGMGNSWRFQTYPAISLFPFHSNMSIQFPLITNRIHNTSPDKHNFNYTDTPKAGPKDASVIELTTPGSSQRVWQESGHTLILLATGAPRSDIIKHVQTCQQLRTIRSIS